MDASNRIKRIDELGRIVIPKDIRKALDINPEDEVEVTVSGETILVKKAQDRCVFCDSPENLILYKGRRLCKSCLKAIRNL